VAVLGHVRRVQRVTMSKPGSLVRAMSGYNTDVEEDALAILPSVTGLRCARLRACSGGGEDTVNELEDRLVLTPERPSEMLPDEPM